MNKTKRFLFSGITAFLILGTLLGIIFAKPVYATSQIPTNCAHLTTNNPRHTPYCNPQCSSTNCISYCPAYNGGAKIKITKSIKNLIVRYKAPTHPIWITIPGTSIQNVKISCGGPDCAGIIKDTSGTVFNKGTILTIIVRDREGYAIGFRAPDSHNRCGQDNICREDGGHYGLFSIQEIINNPDNKHTLISKQCYGDSPIGDSDFDFNDYALAIFGEPVGHIVGKDPFCAQLTAQTNQQSPVKNTYALKCSVRGNVNECKYQINGKTFTSKLNDPDGCVVNYTFTKPGDYAVTCFAVDTKTGKQNTNNLCTQKIHVPEDTAGGLTLPIVSAVITGAGIFMWLSYSSKKKLTIRFARIR